MKRLVLITMLLIAASFIFTQCSKKQEVTFELSPKENVCNTEPITEAMVLAAKKKAEDNIKKAKEDIENPDMIILNMHVLQSSKVKVLEDVAHGFRFMGPNAMVYFHHKRHWVELVDFYPRPIDDIVRIETHFHPSPEVATAMKDLSKKVCVQKNWVFKVKHLKKVAKKYDGAKSLYNELKKHGKNAMFVFSPAKRIGYINGVNYNFACSEGDREAISLAWKEATKLGPLEKIDRFLIITLMNLTQAITS